MGPTDAAAAALGSQPLLLPVVPRTRLMNLDNGHVGLLVLELEPGQRPTCGHGIVVVVHDEDDLIGCGYYCENEKRAADGDDAAAAAGLPAIVGCVVTHEFATDGAAAAADC